jgi:hypothetical protein
MLAQNCEQKGMEKLEGSGRNGWERTKNGFREVNRETGILKEFTSDFLCPNKLLYSRFRSHLKDTSKEFFFYCVRSSGYIAVSWHIPHPSQTVGLFTDL